MSIRYVQVKSGLHLIVVDLVPSGKAISLRSDQGIIDLYSLFGFGVDPEQHINHCKSLQKHIRAGNLIVVGQASRTKKTRKIRGGLHSVDPQTKKTRKIRGGLHSVDPQVYWLVSVETHWRQMMPSMIKHGYRNIFCRAIGGLRNRHGLSEVSRGGVNINNLVIHKGTNWIRHCLSSYGNVIALPLVLPHPSPISPSYGVSGYNTLLKTPLDRIPSSIFLLDEDFYNIRYDYPRHVHACIARSQVEADFLLRCCKKPTKVFTVGDMGLDHGGYAPRFSRNEGKWGIFTSNTTVGGRNKGSIDTLRSVLKDIEHHNSLLNIDEIVHRPHPSEIIHKGELKTSKVIKEFCKRSKVRFRYFDKYTPIFPSLDYLDGAFVIGSFRLHLELRKRGIRSYYYRFNDPDIFWWQNRFFDLTNYPGCRLGDDDGKADEWARETFLLDGRSVDRFQDCVQLYLGGRND